MEKFEKPTIVLASGSPYRAKLLKDKGFSFVKVLRPIDEDKLNAEFNHEDVSRVECEEYVRGLALAKLQPFIDDPIEGGAVVTADTVVWCKRKILEKPLTKEKCLQQHEFVSGGSSYYITGYAVVFDGRIETEVKVTKCRTKEFPKSAIEAVCNEEWTWKVAGHRADGELAPYCSMPDGGRENWIGLCTKVLNQLLKKVGYKRR
ncbi:MAG: Maf family protein [Firmicutes bacterium]|nr:Maf family protein [Bacillota bacterium]